PDAQGGIGRPWQVEDTLSMMLKAGSIDSGLYQASLTFHDEFRRAARDTLKASDPTRTPVQTNTARVWQTLEWVNPDAKRAVDDAIDKLGGPQSAGGACVLDVLGFEMTLNAWAKGRRIHPQRASGILITALGVLAKHYGLT